MELCWICRYCYVLCLVFSSRNDSNLNFMLTSKRQNFRLMKASNMIAHATEWNFLSWRTKNPKIRSCSQILHVSETATRKSLSALRFWCAEESVSWNTFIFRPIRVMMVMAAINNRNFSSRCTFQRSWGVYVSTVRSVRSLKMKSQKRRTLRKVENERDFVAVRALMERCFPTFI